MLMSWNKEMMNSNQGDELQGNKIIHKEVGSPS